MKFSVGDKITRRPTPATHYEVMAAYGTPSGAFYEMRGIVGNGATVASQFLASSVDRDFVKVQPGPDVWVALKADVAGSTLLGVYSSSAGAHERIRTVAEQQNSRLGADHADIMFLRQSDGTWTYGKGCGETLIVERWCLNP